MYFWRLFKYSFHRFIDAGCIYRSAELTFTVLLSLVPLLAVTFAILAVFPFFNEIGLQIQDFIISNFVAASGKAIQGYIQNFAKNVSQLSYVSVAFLIAAAILMMFTIEQAFNAIWRVKKQRHFGSALLLYWGVLILVPIAIGAGLLITSFITAIPIIHHLLEDFRIKIFFLPLISLLLSTALFTTMYVVVPNCKVRFTQALIGGGVAGVLFETAKASFGFYLYYFPTYQLIFGTLSAIPIFLIWVYLSWLIILLGAVITHTIAVKYKIQKNMKLNGFAHALLWLKYFDAAKKEGRDLSFQDLIEKDDYDYCIEPEDLLENLTVKGIIQPTKRMRYELNKELSLFTLADLYNALPWKLSTSDEMTRYEFKWDALLENRLAIAQKSILENLHVPLNQIFSHLP